MTLHPDRALSRDDRQGAVAKQICKLTAALPLIRMHGYVQADVLVDSAPMADPVHPLVAPDHHVTRMTVSQASARRLGVCATPEIASHIMNAYD